MKEYTPSFPQNWESMRDFCCSVGRCLDALTDMAERYYSAKQID